MVLVSQKSFYYIFKEFKLGTYEILKSTWIISKNKPWSTQWFSFIKCSECDMAKAAFVRASTSSVAGTLTSSKMTTRFAIFSVSWRHCWHPPSVYGPACLDPILGFVDQDYCAAKRCPLTLFWLPKGRFLGADILQQRNQQKTHNRC